MIFNSLNFLLFFPVVVVIYFLIPQRYRWLHLLISSCYFYMVFVPAYILILTVTIVIDYYAGILISRSADKKKKWYLIISVLSTLAVLFIFKYYNFFQGSMHGLADMMNVSYDGQYWDIILPVGLSFHTFQSLSYVIEVYRGHQKPEHHFGKYALYVMFFPQLVAGPIERPQNILHQIHEEHKFKYMRIVDGLKLMAWGMFKKVVIADTLAVMVNQVYNSPQEYEGIPLIVATIFFTFQIYCDFSGYSDIAIGAARVMGYDLMKNFRQPYFSMSISEFWRRWHISLSTWFKDYLYVPLGGNKVARWRWYMNIAIIFTVSGLWHGANWTFVIWGALHAVYIVVGGLTAPITNKIFVGKLGAGLRIFGTFCMVAFAWIFFRANSMEDASYIVSHLFTGIPEGLSQILANENMIRTDLLYLGTDLSTVAWVLVFIGVMEVVHYFQLNNTVTELIKTKPTIVRWGLYVGVMLVIIFFGEYGAEQQFIYFQF